MSDKMIDILLNQYADPMIFGILAIFLTPMVFGAITTHYAHKYTQKITEEVWKEWREDPEFQKQKVTSSINYND